MIEVTPLIFFSIIGVYTTTVVGCIMWLNGRFASIEKAILERIPFIDFERRHDALETRVRNMEIQIAARHWGAIDSKE